MIRLFATHPTLPNALMLVLILLGVMALPGLQRDTFPLVPPSDVEISISYPGATPAEVESGVCRVAEPVLSEVDRLDELQCLARDNQALITASLQEGEDMARFHNDLKAAVDGIKTFEEQTEAPVTRVVERIASVASVAITGSENPRVLQAFADALADQLRADPLITQVVVSGFASREIAISFRREALDRIGLGIADVAGILAQQNLTLPAGTLAGPDGEPGLRFDGEKISPQELASIPLIVNGTGGRVLLGEVAEIREQFSDASGEAYFDKQRAAIVSVNKTASQDALRVKAAMDRVIQAALATAPATISITLSQDSTANIRDRLRIIYENGLQGLALVLLVMWLFFGLRLSFWVAMGLPVSFLGAIFVMQLLGYTLNMMTMVALLVAIGLLMDDAIVIAENIVRRFQAGESPAEAVSRGARQVAPGVLAAFLTTAMIVGPLGMMTGNIGAVLKYIPIVLLVVLIVSLIEAFLILPGHLYHALPRITMSGPVQGTVNRLFDGLSERVMVPLSRWCLRWRYLTLGVAVGLVLLSLAPISGGFLKYQSFPTLESDTVEARLLLVQGSPVSRTEERVNKAVAALEQLNQEWSPEQPQGQALVQGFTVTYGSNPDTPERGVHMATISARLLPAGVRSTEVKDIVDRWRQLTGPMPDMAAMRFTDKERGAGGKPIDLRLQGAQLADLYRGAREIRGFYRNYAGVRDVTTDLQPGKPEYRVRLREAPAAALGVTPRALASALRAAFNGDKVMQVQDALGTLDMVVRLQAGQRRTAGDILRLNIRAADGTLVPLNAVADVSRSRGFATINRIDGQRTVAIQGTINPAIANARELNSAFRSEFLPGFLERHPDLTVRLLGEEQDTQTTGSSLAKNLLLGAIGVYLILVVQFRHYLLPLVALMAVPMSLVGVVWGHMLLGMPLSLPSLLGLATLVGVAINDAILLVMFIQEKLSQGLAMVDAGVGAVRERFRAVFLTSLTTVVGLMPLLLEQSTQAQFLRPIIASLAFGLSAATLLGLVVTPAAYAVLSDLGLGRRQKVTAPVA